MENDKSMINLRKFYRGKKFLSQVLQDLKVRG